MTWSRASGVPETDVAIGPNDHHGLRFTQQFVQYGFRISEVPTISGDVDYPVVSYNGKSILFTKTGSVFIQASRTWSLTLGTSTSVFTASDGTIIEFGHSTRQIFMEHINGRVIGTKITFPDGVVWDFHYNLASVNDYGYITNGARLSSITSSTGYQIKLSYSTDTFTSQTFYGTSPTVVKSTALNNAVEYCDPQGCTPSSQWFSATYGHSFTPYYAYSVTDFTN